MLTDAFSLDIDVVFMYIVARQRPHIVACASCVFIFAESRYIVTHLEALAVVWALKHYRGIIFGYPFTVYTELTAVAQLFRGKNLTNHLARW